MDPGDPVPSATVALLRDGRTGLEVLLVRRADKLAFHGGAWVFPGGRVEADDADAASDEATGLRAAKHAAGRETREETGLGVPLAGLLPMARWTTPPGRVRRFRTWFFVAGFEDGEVSVDGEEIHDHRWVRPADALRAHALGEMMLPPPTFVTLTHLGRHTACSDALRRHATHPPEVFTPRPREIRGGAVSLYEGDVAYEGGDLRAPGPRHRLWMLGSDWRYERDS